MNTAGPSNFSVGALAPVLALGALGLGVAALFAPIPFLKPPEVSPAADSTIGPAPRPTPTVKPIVPEDWSRLAESLSKLREPLTQAEIERVVKGEESPPVEPVADTGPVHQPLRWRYIGYITEPDRVAALVLMNDSDQRLIYAGDTFKDSTDPENLDITIISVTETEITIERAGRHERFQLNQAQSEPPSATSPLRPPPTTPRGAPPPRR
jgi:hypothetical protein